MKTNITSVDFPQELEGFVGGMGFKSIASISEAELGFSLDEFDVKGYISEPVDSVYYAEVRDGEGNCEFACGNIDDLQKWITDTVYKFCQK